MIVDIFFTLVFLEIIELNFCGLNKYLKENIMERAVEDNKECVVEDNYNPIINDDYIIDIREENNDDDKPEDISELGIEMEKCKN